MKLNNELRIQIVLGIRLPRHRPIWVFPVGTILRSVSPMVVVVPDRSPVLVLPWIRTVPEVRTGWRINDISDVTPSVTAPAKLPRRLPALDIAGAKGSPTGSRRQVILLILGQWAIMDEFGHGDR